MTIAQLADPDPWRNQLRTIDEKPAEASDRLRKLANDKTLEAQSAISLILMAVSVKNTLKDAVGAERILRRAAVRYPDDFWINFELGCSFCGERRLTWNFGNR